VVRNSNRRNDFCCTANLRRPTRNSLNFSSISVTNSATVGTIIADMLRMFSSCKAGLARRSCIYDVSLGNVNGRGTTIEDTRCMNPNHNNQRCERPRFPTIPRFLRSRLGKLGTICLHDLRISFVDGTLIYRSSTICGQSGVTREHYG
jgi:hypothetical protein